MIEKVTYKLQGKGTLKEFDSWIIEYNDGRIPDIVYEDPNIIKKMNISNIDINTLNDSQVEELKTILGIN
tara:strand:- start:98 stop:307 length:210 start_codon:yes stop_codon:yes gene_type:complete